MSDNQIRTSVWIDRELMDRFTRLFPAHGAFTTFVRRALIQHVDRFEKQGKELLGE